MSEPTRYPLAWPAGRPRTKVRKQGSFRAYDRTITVTAAISRLNDEIDRLGGRYPILSTMLETRMDGTPYLNRGMPADPGACLYFQLKGEPYALACDTFTDLAQNIAALAGHIEATRRITRYGVATASETLRAFHALPPPIITEPPPKPWHEVFGVVPGVVDASDIEALYRTKARKAHPDAGGSEAAMAELNRARDAALKELTQ